MTDTTTEPQTPTLPDAVTEFVSVFSHGDTAEDLAVRLSCTEVDALAGLLRAFGQDEAADLWIAAHANDDDEGDAHTPDGARGSRVCSRSDMALSSTRSRRACSAP